MIQYGDELKPRLPPVKGADDRTEQTCCSDYGISVPATGR